jgi:hypothetical protein
VKTLTLWREKGGEWLSLRRDEKHCTEVVFEYDENAPCQLCQLPVREASMSGTAICPWCDCGYFRDGERWTLTPLRDWRPSQWAAFREEAWCRATLPNATSAGPDDASPR